MSFSSKVKEELNKSSNLANKELVKYELLGYFLSGNTSLINEKALKFATESDYNINRFSKLLSNLEINHNIDIVGKSFIITVKIKDLLNLIEQKQGSIVLTQKIRQELLEGKVPENRLRDIIRGLFLGSGSINNPQKKYHLEMLLSNEQNLQDAMLILENLGMKPKKVVTKYKYSIYMKEGEEISNFLALIGANKAVLEFENIRIQREMRGKVNRIVNCEAANLNKTINASIAQIAAIKKLQENGKFNKLDDNLREIAELRLENPDMSLVDLGKLLKQPVGKSGVNYRLKKIMEMADEG